MSQKAAALTSKNFQSKWLKSSPVRAKEKMVQLRDNRIKTALRAVIANSSTINRIA